MMDHWIFFLLSICIHHSCVVHSGQLYEMDYQLMFDKLTEPGTYQKYIRPPVEQNGLDSTKVSTRPIFINISIELYNYAIVDEITSEYTFHLFIDMEWVDPRLKFPSVHPDYILEGGQHHLDRIWCPTLFVPNDQDPGSFDYDHESANFIRLKPSTGFIWLRKRKMLRIYCDMDFHLYPFDKQKCELQMESSINTITNMRLRWNRENSFSQTESFRTIGFTLGHYEQFEVNKTYSKHNSFSRVSLRFELAREWAHHIFLFYLPSAIIVVASWSSFWLEITSPPARASVGVTTMLALVTTFKNTKSQLPNVSYWNALDIWNMVCIVFIFSSLMEFAIVNYIFNTEKRKRKKQKLQRKRRNTIFNATESLAKSNSRRSSTYQSTINAFSELNNKLADLDSRNSSIDSSAEPPLDLTKRRRSSVNLNIINKLPNIREEPSGRRRSRAVSNLSAMVVVSMKLSPEELAVEIDRKCRRIFPFLFLVFNFLYWILLVVRF